MGILKKFEYYYTKINVVMSVQNGNFEKKISKKSNFIVYF